MKRLVIGLGNPGAEYETTRHNIGWRVLDTYAKGLGVADWHDKPRLESTVLTTPDVILAKPQTYMNESGRAIRKVADYHKVSPENLILLSDDLDLPFGTVRFRKGGSSGGQRGLEDAIRALGTEDVPRLRVGIGPPPPGRTATEHVLGAFNSDEADRLREVLKTAVEELEAHV